MLFCALSGTVYLLNDVADFERDRLHPLKRLRPIASGALSARAARAAAIVLGAASPAWGFAPPRPAFAACAVAYLVLNLLYSFHLKDVVILDVLGISLGFVLRAVAGAVAIGVADQRWLLVCTLLLALFLALAKRRHELVTLSTRRRRASASPGRIQPLPARPDDRGGDGVVRHRLRLLHHWPRRRGRSTATDRLAWTIPFVLYGIFRYLYLVHQKEQGGSPPTSSSRTGRSWWRWRCGPWRSCSSSTRRAARPCRLATDGRGDQGRRRGRHHRGGGAAHRGEEEGAVHGRRDPEIAERPLDAVLDAHDFKADSWRTSGPIPPAGNTSSTARRSTAAAAAGAGGL